MNPLYKIGGIAVAVVLTLFVTYQMGVSSGVNKERAKWLVEQEVWREDMAELSRKMDERKAEHELIVSKLETNHLAEVKKIEKSKDSIISELRSGNLKLRQRFQGSRTCPAESGNTDSSSNSHAAGGGGLSNADAEFLIRFAGQCDATARQLKSAQDYIKSLEVFR